MMFLYKLIKPRSSVRSVKFVLTSLTALVILLLIINEFYRRTEENQRLRDEYSKRVQLEKLRLEQLRNEPYGLSLNDEKKVTHYV